MGCEHGCCGFNSIVVQGCITLVPPGKQLHKNKIFIDSDLDYVASQYFDADKYVADFHTIDRDRDDGKLLI